MVIPYVNNRYPLSRLYRTSYRAALELWSGPFSTDGRIVAHAEPDFVFLDAGIYSLDRRVVLNITEGPDPYIDFRNIAVKADGYSGQSVTLGYTKSDSTTGTLTFRRGLLTSFS